MFEELPSKTRAKFNNDPGEFIKFVNNPMNAQEIYDMGLTKGLDGINAKGEHISSSPLKDEVFNPPRPQETPPAASDKPQTGG